jgi:hypothetical protein
MPIAKAHPIASTNAAISMVARFCTRVIPSSSSNGQILHDSITHAAHCPKARNAKGQRVGAIYCNQTQHMASFYNDSHRM